jgi:putative ABC transport system substrate-binding protein
MFGMTRREFIALVGGAAAAWPFAARAQQPTMPLLGVLDSGSADKNEQYLAPFWQGLSGAGYVEGQNVAAEYRWFIPEWKLALAGANPLSGRKMAWLGQQNVPYVHRLRDDRHELGTRE